MFPSPDSGGPREDGVLADRVEALVAWIQELEVRVRTAEVATGDEKTAKELRKAVEAAVKYDPKLEDRVTNRVDVLKDRLAMLAETVSTTSASLAAKDGELVALRRALETATAKIEALAADRQKGSGSSSADVEELRKAVAALSAERSKRRGGRRDSDDGVPGKIDIFEQRLDTVAKTVSTTAAGLASRDGDLAALRRDVEEGTAEVKAALAGLRAEIDPAPVAELRLTVKELADRTAAQKRQGQRALDEVAARVDAAASSLETLARTTDATASRLGSGEQELAALRSEFDEEAGRLDTHVASIERVLGTVTPQLARLDGFADRGSVENVVGQLQRVSESIAAVSTRLDGLTQAVDETGRGYTERELELAALSRRFDEGRAQVEALVDDLRQALASAGPEFEARLESRLQPELERISVRISEFEREHAVTAGRVEQALAGSAEERESLAASTRLLEERVQGVAETVESAFRRLEHIEAQPAPGPDPEQAARLEELARELEASAAERESLAASTRLLEERVQGVAETVESAFRRLEHIEAQPAPGPDPEQASRLEELAERLAALDRSLPAVQQAAAAARDEASGARAELARELAATSDERESLAASARVLEERVLAVSESVESAFRRLERIEAQPALTPDPEHAARLDELAQQLAALERTLPDLGDAAAAARDEASRVRAELERELAGSVEERESLAASARLLEERVQGVSESVESAFRRLEHIEAQPAPGPDPEQAARLEELASRVDAESATTADASAGLAEARSGLDAVTRRIDDLAAAVQENAIASTQKEAELAALSSRFEDAGAKVDSLVGELREALETMPAARLDPDLGEKVAFLAERVDAITGQVQATASREETDRLLGKLLLRLDAVEDAQESVKSELARASADPSSLEEDVRELRAAIESLTARLAESDERLVSMAERQEAAAAEPAPGDGKLRLELRGLEVRMESAEAAARESREAVLRQLERLASRVEWRLQRLEPDEPSYTEAHSPQAAESSGQIVPIRGSEG